MRMNGFEILESKPVLSTPYFVIQKDSVVYPDGTPGDYWVMNRPSFSSMVALDERKRICLIEIYRHPVRAMRWEIPQGGVEGSRSAYEEVLEEARQEAGLSLTNVREIGLLHEAYGYATGQCTVFSGLLKEQGESNPECSEGIIRNRWVSKDEFWSMVDAGKISDAVTVASVAMVFK